MENNHLIEPVILHYLQGAISEDEMCMLNLWLAESAENKQLLFRLKDIYDMRKGGLYPDDQDIAQSWQRFLHQMTVETRFIASKNGASKNAASNRNVASSPISNQKSAISNFYKYAAVALIFTCLTLAMQLFFQKDTPAHYTALDVESGPRMSRLTLPDGTKVVLNASTKFKFPDRFDGNFREVFLDGEAFFDVTHNEKIPFVVHTAHQKISVLGTSFNVMDYAADDYAITTLASGSVKVQPVGDDGSVGKEYILKPNQQAYFNKITSEVALTNIKIDPARTWVNKIYHFRDEPLMKIAQRLEKIYGVKITIANKELEEVKYTGTFPTDQEINDVLKIINFDKQFSYHIKGDEITIL